MGLLAFLGESADWLKDANGVSIRDHRIAVLDAFRAAWEEPTDDALHEALRKAFTPLFEGLRHNQLYPDGAILGRLQDESIHFLPAPANLRKNFETLRGFCVVNKFGAGELHLLYLVLMLCRMHYQPKGVAYDQVLEEMVGDVLFLRAPAFRADNTAQFSSELKAHFHAVRILRVMKRLGLCGEDPVEKISSQDQSEMTGLLADPISAAAGKAMQTTQQAAFNVLDTASALEAFSRAHEAGRMPLDSRSPEELFRQLRRQLKKLPSHAIIGPNRRRRLHNLGIAAMVRAIAHVDVSLGQSMYGFLRNRKYDTYVRHSRMFDLLPGNAERLRFLNFLYTNGSENPIFYITKFERFFQGHKLRFERRDVGFSLQPPPET